VYRDVRMFRFLCAVVSPVFALPYRQMVQSVGTDALLTCLLHAFPPAQLLWRRPATSDSNEPIQITSNEKYRLHNWTVDEYSILYGLHISSITWSDYGSYYCVANNSLGIDRAQILIEGNNEYLTLKSDE